MGEIAPMLAHFGYDPHGNPPNYGKWSASFDEYLDSRLFVGKPDKFVVDNTNDIKAHDQDWEEIGETKIWFGGTENPLSAERVKSLSKKDTAPRGRKDEIKDFDQWSKEEQTTSGPFFQRRTIILSLVNQCLAFVDRNEVIELYYTLVVNGEASDLWKSGFQGWLDKGNQPLFSFVAQWSRNLISIKGEEEIILACWNYLFIYQYLPSCGK